MNQQWGFTLFELLCVMAIFSLLAHFGMSNILFLNQQQQDQQNLKAQVARLASALTRARELAVVSGHSSFVCGGMACSGEWSRGFRLYQTHNNTDYDVLNEVFIEALSLHWRGFPAQKKQIEYQANGLSGYQNGTFVFCLGKWQMDVVLNQSGRFYLSHLKSRRSEGDCL
ncbi:GspH/FimT family pseudopilin [Marinomonas sp. THO17]|uniref:GspH/FimT family pseudopilin n=1 Tax=Marinomonas sp. THO17 TaxID=3149048 RepID=UPI00336BCC25